MGFVENYGLIDPIWWWRSGNWWKGNGGKFQSRFRSGGIWREWNELEQYLKLLLGHWDKQPHFWLEFKIENLKF